MSASSPSGYLRHQLISSLFSAKIGEIHHLIRLQYTHYTHVVEIQSLGHHLCANQNVSLPVLKILQNLFISAFCRCRIHIQPFYTSQGEQRSNHLLNTLSAESHPVKSAGTAFWAHLRNSVTLAAVVTY